MISAWQEFFYHAIHLRSLFATVCYGTTQVSRARRSGPSGRYAADRAIERPTSRVKQSLRCGDVHRLELADAAVRALALERLRSAYCCLWLTATALCSHRARMCGDDLPANALKCPNAGVSERAFEIVVGMASSQLNSHRDNCNIAEFPDATVRRTERVQLQQAQSMYFKVFLLRNNKALVVREQQVVRKQFI